MHSGCHSSTTVQGKKTRSARSALSVRGITIVSGALAPVHGLVIVLHVNTCMHWQAPIGSRPATIATLSYSLSLCTGPNCSRQSSDGVANAKRLLVLLLLALGYAALCARHSASPKTHAWQRCSQGHAQPPLASQARPHRARTRPRLSRFLQQCPVRAPQTATAAAVLRLPVQLQAHC
jgi:hypothetical protein